MSGLSDNAVKPNLRIFGYSCKGGSFSPYGITCGIIIAESFAEAKKEVKKKWYGHKVELTEIPFEKGCIEIGSYSEEVF